MLQGPGLHVTGFVLQGYTLPGTYITGYMLHVTGFMLQEMEVHSRNENRRVTATSLSYNHLKV